MTARSDHISLTVPALPISQKKRRTTLKDSSLKKRGLEMSLSHMKTSMPLIIRQKPSKLRNRRPFEEREIKALSSQMRQSVIEEIQDNIKAFFSPAVTQ
jgi:tRNA A37 threonylcarbamoyltransferase TsaD